MTTQHDPKRADDAGDTSKPDSDHTSGADADRREETDADRGPGEETDSAAVDALYEQAVRRIAALDADWAQVMEGFARRSPQS